MTDEDNMIADVDEAARLLNRRVESLEELAPSLTVSLDITSAMTRQTIGEKRKRPTDQVRFTVTREIARGGAS